MVKFVVLNLWLVVLCITNILIMCRIKQWRFPIGTLRTSECFNFLNFHSTSLYIKSYQRTNKCIEFHDGKDISRESRLFCVKSWNHWDNMRQRLLKLKKEYKGCEPERAKATCNSFKTDWWLFIRHKHNLDQMWLVSNALIIHLKNYFIILFYVYVCGSEALYAYHVCKCLWKPEENMCVASVGAKLPILSC